MKRNNTIKFNILAFTFGCFLLSFPLLAQKKAFSFSGTPITEIIKTIETKEQLIFNYDPALLADYSYSGQLDFQSPTKAIEKLLYQTPFSFDVNEKTVLVYLPSKTTYSICGYVYEHLSQSPLPYATIVSEDHTFFTQTNEKGYFQLDLEVYKHQKVAISYLGYESINLMIQEFPLSDCKKFILKNDLDLFSQEIIVTEYILDGISQGETYSGYTMDYEKLTNSYSSVEHDILKTVQLLPGITSLDESSTNLQIRGSSVDQNLILWEGVPLYDPGHLFGMISAINPFVIDEVSVFKGAYDPKYDNRVGGIVAMSLKDSVSNDLRGSIGTSLSEVHASLEIPLIKDKLSCLVSGRHTIHPIYASPPLNSYSQKVFQFSKIDEQAEDVEEGFIDIEQFLNYYDWNAKLIYQINDRLKFKTSVFNSQNRFNYFATILDEDLHTEDEVDVQSFALKSSLEAQINPRWNSEIAVMRSVYTNRYDFQFSESEDSILVEQNMLFNDIEDNTIAWSNRYQLTPKMKLTFGYDYNIKQVNFNFESQNRYEGSYNDVNFALGHYHNAFAGISILQKNWQFNTGLRTTYDVENQSFTFAPRLNFEYVLEEGLKFKTEAGIFHQYISQLRDFGHTDLGVSNPIWIINEAETDFSQGAQKVAVGFSYNKKGFLLDVEGYYNFTDGLSTLSPVLGQNDLEISEGTSQAFGLDILIKKRWKPYKVWLNYSFGKVDNFFPELYAEPFSANNDIRHNLSVVNSYTYKNWHFSLSWQYHSGIPFSAPLGFSPIFDEEGEIDFHQLDFETLNNERLPFYSRLDMGINYRPSFKNSKLKADFAFSCINLLGRDNLFSKDYFIEDFEEEGILELAYFEKSLLERTPLLMVRFYW